MKKSILFCLAIAMAWIAQSANITFKVNMNLQTVSPNGVHVAGNFQGWNPATSAMTDANGDGIYEATISVTNNQTLVYKFINGNSWTGAEIVPTACGVNDGSNNINRNVVVNTSDIILEPVCFGQCANCPSTIQVTLRVNMNNQTVGANGVHVAGNFQGWNPASSPLADADGDGIYSGVFLIGENQTIEYKFINGNAWGMDESVPAACATGSNRTLVVANTNITTAAFCFGECAECTMAPIAGCTNANACNYNSNATQDDGSCLVVGAVCNDNNANTENDVVSANCVCAGTAVTGSVQVTFQVNMSQQTVSPMGVYIAGNFQGWNPSTTAMTDANGDNIYEYTATLTPNQTIEYKFINGNAWGMDESVPAACATGSNRTLVVGNANITTTAFCFGECAECTIAPIAGCTNANACNYNSNATQDDGSCLVVGAVCNDNNANTENDVVSANCVCAGTAVTGSVQVTFQVNMSQQTVSPMGVYIAGNFQGWNPSTTAMTDANGDNIYEYTATLTPNQTIEYKFINGNAWGMDESVPAACATGSNRTLVVANANITTAAFCFGECAACTIAPIAGCTNSAACNFNSNATQDDGSCLVVGAVCNDNNANTENDVVSANCVCAGTAITGSVQVTFQVNMSQQTVSPMGVYIAGNFQGWNPSTSAMTDANADNIYEYTATVTPNQTIEYKFINGNAWGMDESVPAACATGSNRTLVVANANITTTAFCFGECAECTMAPIAGCTNANACNYNSNATQDDGSCLVVGAVCNDNNANTENDVVSANCVCAGTAITGSVQVTFQVNMSQQTVSPMGVHIAGNFQGWNPSTTAMTDANGDNIYEYTASVTPNQTIEYKFINGNAWGMDESVPAACATGSNRTLVVANANITTTAFCFGECAACGTVAVPGCTNSTACNFDSAATEDDGSCIAVGDACNDNDATTVNDVIGANCQCAGSAGIPTMVIFRVDMTNQNVSPNGVFVVGTFNNWDLTLTQMTEYQPGFYQAVAFINAGETIQYKFVNGGTWTGSETVPSACGTDDGTGNINRSATIGNTALTMEPVCFSECGACVAIPMTAVTFTVNMSQQTVDPNGVQVVGSFQNWTLNASAMTNTGNGLYSFTTNIPTGTSIQYKFINGNTWSGAETVAFGCAVNDGSGNYNRAFNVTGTAVNIPTVCFNECENCIMAGCTNPSACNYDATATTDDGSCLITNAACDDGNANTSNDIVNADCVCLGTPVAGALQVTFRVNMSQQSVSAQGVHIAGNFQNWDPAATEMTDGDGDGIFEYTTFLTQNQTIEYKFINGNSWGAGIDESVPAACATNNNRTLVLSTTNVTTPAYCFGSCSPCESNVIVVFQVDMTNETVAAGGVHVATNWDGFNPNANLMTDLGNGVYEVAVTLPANETTLFRFVNGNGTNQFETVPLTCGVADGMGNFNRAIAVGTTNTIFGPVCFSGCANCQPIVPVQVTFQVDMSNQTVDPNGVHIAGEFQNPQWDPAATIMTDNGNGIWSYTTTVNSGSTFQYKFINGNAWTGEESVPMECGNPNGLGGYNRIFTVGTNDVMLNTVCFSECTGCNTGADIAVTFQVNLSEVAAVSPNGVHLVGSFQNYDPAATPMTDQGNGIYSVQVTIPSGSFIFYRFINGNTNADAETVPFSCGVLNNGGYFERVAQLDSTTTEMPLVCFSECNDCGNAIEENANPHIQVYPNPSSVYCTLQSQELIQHYAIVDATGRKIAEGNGIGQYALPINIQNWENGIYVIIVNHQHRLPLMKTE